MRSFTLVDNLLLPVQYKGLKSQCHSIIVNNYSVVLNKPLIHPENTEETLKIRYSDMFFFFLCICFLLVFISPSRAQVFEFKVWLEYPFFVNWGSCHSQILVIEKSKKACWKKTSSDPPSQEWENSSKKQRSENVFQAAQCYCYLCNSYFHLPITRW